MYCRLCKSKCKVVNSRNSLDANSTKKIPNKLLIGDEQITYRDHKCTQCGLTQQSIEIEVNAYTRLEDRVRQKLIAKLGM